MLFYRGHLFSVRVLDRRVISFDENILDELYCKRRFTDTTGTQDNKLVLLHVFLKKMNKKNSLNGELSSNV
jgi:hypothetical protein